MPLTDVQARRALNEPTGAPDFVAMIRIAGGLDRRGPLLTGGLSPQVLADVLHAELRPTWRRSTDHTEPARYPFQPYNVDPAELKSPASRVGVAIADADQAPLRTFAQSAAPPLVRARCFDMLWERFRIPGDAASAIEDYLSYASGAPAESWVEGERCIGRAAVLISLRNDTARVASLLDAFDQLATTVVSSRYYFAFAPLADALVTTVLRSRVRDAVPVDLCDRWATTLEWVAEDFFGRDAWYGRTCYAALAEMFVVLGRPSEALRVRRRLVEHLLACTATASALIGSSHASAALDAALTFGFADLVEQAKTKLHDRVVASRAEMKTFSMPLELPAEIVAEIENIVDSAPSAASAIRTLGGLVGLCDVPVDAANKAATEQLQQSVLSALIPTAHHRDGKIVFKGTDPASKLREAVARNYGAHLVLVEHLLVHTLTRLAGRMRPETMAVAVGDWAWFSSKRGPWLHRASERFHAGDFMSCGLILATQYEAIVRDLMRAAGMSALKTDAAGILMDASLGSLLQEQALRDVLGEDHLRFVEYVLSDSEVGANLRNEVAHGNLAPWELTAGRVCLLWLFIIRLTFFGPMTTLTTSKPGGQPAEGEAAAATDESATTAPTSGGSTAVETAGGMPTRGETW
ncbi:MAG TPA: DUF4209 domain-containing protein [Polyangiaceae bacterium]